MSLFGWYPYHPNDPSGHIDPTSSPRTTEIVHCRTCQRRVGLWGFKSDLKNVEKGDLDGIPVAKEPKSFDLLDQHEEWCPLSLLKVKSGQEVKVGKGWVSVSEKMEKKKWRRG